MARTKWTEDKVQFLKENYHSMSIDEITENLNISKWTIYEKVKELGIGKQFKWTKEKVEILKEYYPSGNWDILFDKIGTTNKQCIIYKAYSLGIHTDSNVWTKDDIKYLIDNYGRIPISEIAKHLNRTEGAIMTKSYKLNITNPNVWTDEDIELLKELYPIHSNKYLSDNIFTTKSPESIRTKGLLLGLHKSKEKGVKKYYDKDLILQQLKDVAKEIGRTPLYSELCSLGLPSEKTFERLFGSYKIACFEASIDINKDVYGNNSTYIASDDTLCWSYSEFIITEYLIEHKLYYQKELYYKDFRLIIIT